MAIYYPLHTDLVSEWPGDRGGWWHYGTDFAVPVNTELKASFDGTIVFAGGDGASGQINGVYANGEGLTVDIQRSDGLVARYGHMNRIDVTVGQTVKAGQVIGLSGNTGYTTGPHCHWELRYDRAWSGGEWRDPRTLGAINFGTTKKRSIAMGSYTPSTPQTVPAKKWARVKKDKKGNVTLTGANKTGLAVVSLNLRGVSGQQVQARIIEDTWESGKGVTSTRVLRTVSGVIPKRGLLKLQITAGYKTGKSEKLRVQVRDDSGRSFKVSHIGWDLLS